MRVIDDRPGDSSYARPARRIKVPDNRAALLIHRPWMGREFKITKMSEKYVSILALVEYGDTWQGDSLIASPSSGINVETSHSDGRDQTDVCVPLVSKLMPGPAYSAGTHRCVGVIGATQCHSWHASIIAPASCSLSITESESAEADALPNSVHVHTYSLCPRPPRPSSSLKVCSLQGSLSLSHLGFHTLKEGEGVIRRQGAIIVH